MELPPALMSPWSGFSMPAIRLTVDFPRPKGEQREQLAGLYRSQAALPP
jgi:hypothetical protein